MVSTIGFLVLQQVVGLGRQAQIAAFFGLSREFDAYLVTFSVATMFVFSLAAVFDTVAVARLVQIREREGDPQFWRASNRLLWQSGLVGLVFAAGLVGILYLIMPIVAAGFSEEERALVHKLGFYFVPWAIIALPYYAVAAHLKALWRFHLVFTAELAVMGISIVVLVIWHDSVFDLPIAYAAGYACGLLGLLACRGIVWTGASGRAKDLSVGMANQYLANQIGTLAGLVDRYFQSFLMGGGISALGYSGLVVNNLSSLMTFREIYVVPLASELGRNERLARMLSGIALVSVPFTCFVIAYAEPIVQVLFERGKFGAADTALTATVMQILAVSLLSSSLLAPMVRLFQIINRIAYSHLLYLASLIGTATFQYLLVFHFRLDVHGFAWASVGNSAALTLFVAALVRRCGITINWRSVLGNAALAATISLAALAVSKSLSIRSEEFMISLIIGAASYWAIVAIAYFALRERLRRIIGLPTIAAYPDAR
jgi:putative peptidoglycan lipid II flippase